MLPWRRLPPEECSANPSHQLPRMFETREVTQFRHRADCRREVDSAHRLQSQYDWIEPPTNDGFTQSQLQPLALRER